MHHPIHSRSETNTAVMYGGRCGVWSEIEAEHQNLPTTSRWSPPPPPPPPEMSLNICKRRGYITDANMTMLLLRHFAIPKHTLSESLTLRRIRVTNFLQTGKKRAELSHRMCRTGAHLPMIGLGWRVEGERRYELGKRLSIMPVEGETHRRQKMSHNRQTTLNRSPINVTCNVTNPAERVSSLASRSRCVPGFSLAGSFRSLNE